MTSGRLWAIALAVLAAVLLAVVWLFGSGGFAALTSDALWGPYGTVQGLYNQADALLHRQWPAFFFGILLVIVLIYLRFM